MKIQLKNRFLISTIAFFLLFAALLAVVVYPAFQEIRIINEQVHQERVRLEQLYVAGQLRKTVQSNFNKIKGDIGFLSNMMLSENQELDYIAAVEQLADRANLDLSIRIGENKIEAKQRFSSLRFTFDVYGDWEDILVWIDSIESLPYYTNMQEMTVAVHGAGEEKNTRTANMTISADTYWLIQ